MSYHEKFSNDPIIFLIDCWTFKSEVTQMELVPVTKKTGLLAD